MMIKTHRIKDFIGKGDVYLPKMIDELVTLLNNGYRIIDEIMDLSSEDIYELATVIVEFGEDINNEIGIWKSYEQYNIDFFDNPLPLLLDSLGEIGKNKFDKLRVYMLLWNTFETLNENLSFASDNYEIMELSNDISLFLQNKFKNVPKDSGIKKYFQQPIKYGWDVKSKLVWLGMHSYLFRFIFEKEIENKENEAEKLTITKVDDYITQRTTIWSGLGPIDIIASVLNIHNPRRKEIREWYDKHSSIYKNLSVSGQKMIVLNVINNKEYTIMIGEGVDYFNIGDYILGSLVFYDRYWYWSGEQNKLGKISEKNLNDLINNFRSKSPRLVYRFDKELLEEAKKSNVKQHKEFLQYFGNDLIVFPDGYKMAAEIQKKDKLSYNKMSVDELAKFIDKHNLKNPYPNYNIPKDILESKDGIGMYYNPTEGPEIMLNFNFVMSGLKKKGKDLTDNEINSLQSLMFSNSISPDFIYKLIYENGDDSLRKVFMVQYKHSIVYLDYLFRKYKGNFYRNRYPFISLI